jgi:hypothetical protein
MTCLWSGRRIELEIPALIAGVQRARSCADRIGDADLSRRLAALQQRLAARS